MDFSASTRIVYERIQRVEPDLVSKIIGYILLQGNGEKEMIRYAFGPDQLINSVIAKAKLDLSCVPAPTSSFPALSRPFSSPANLHVATPYWDPPLILDHNNMDFVPPPFSEDYRYYNNSSPFLSLEEQFEVVHHEYYPDPTLGNMSSRCSRRSPSLPEFPLKLCHYFLRGWCKHGDNCRYFHGHPLPDTLSPLFNPNSNDLINEDSFLPGSLEKLELELTELLKSRRGCPLSIASLPLLYQEKYGRTLQAEGYLTESQRHGKAGYSLTKLLARLKNSIRLIDRPHGQHAVVLAEDAPKFMEYRHERSDPGGVVAGSRQIYLTFPAESTFTEEDVSNYFKNFGPVQDVRIPCQQKRMFGFVTFLYPETVKMILTKGNPHFVCGARVLVKPYREKSRIIDRKYTEKGESSMYYASPYLDIEPEMQPNPRLSETSRLLRKQFIEDQGQTLELEARRLAELHLSQRLPSQQSYFGYPIDDLKASEGHRDHNDADHFSYWFDVLQNGSTSDEKGRLSSTNNYCEKESSQGLNLPESPFASPIASSISTVMI